MRTTKYEKFPVGLREIVMGIHLDDVTPEEKECAFEALVDLLILKKVFKADGSIVKWRDGSIDYFCEIYPQMDEDLQLLVITSPEEIYRRFVFTPVGKTSSLYSEMKKKGATSRLFNIPVDEIYEEYEKDLNKSPYEKNSLDEITEFLAWVEELAIFSLE